MHGNGFDITKLNEEQMKMSFGDDTGVEVAYEDSRPLVIGRVGVSDVTDTDTVIVIFHLTLQSSLRIDCFATNH